MSAYAPSSACGPGCLPRPGATPRVGPLVRATRLAALGFALLLGIAVALAQPVARGRLIRAWFRLLLRCAGVRLVVRGGGVASAVGAAARSTKATLVAANHVSWLDIPALLAVERLRVVAKSDVRRWPLIGVLAAAGGTLFIDRRSLRRLPVTVAEMAASLRAGRSVLVFPEGSTWCGRTHGRFYPAGFQAALDAGTPVRPVLLRYRLADGSATTAAAFVGDDSLLASVLRVVAVRGLTVEVELARLIRAPEGAMGRPHNRARLALAARTAAIIRAAAMNDLGVAHPAEGLHPSEVVDLVE